MPFSLSSSLDGCPCPCEACKRRRDEPFANYREERYRKIEANRFSSELRPSCINDRTKRPNEMMEETALEEEAIAMWPDLIPSSMKFQAGDNYMEIEENGKLSAMRAFDVKSQKERNLKKVGIIQSWSEMDSLSEEHQNNQNLGTYSENFLRHDSGQSYGSYGDSLESDATIMKPLKQIARILANCAFLFLCLVVIFICFAINLGRKIYNSKKYKDISISFMPLFNPCHFSRLKIIIAISFGIAALLMMHAFASMRQPKSIPKIEKQSFFKKLNPVRWFSQKRDNWVQILEKYSAGKAMVKSKRQPVDLMKAKGEEDAKIREILKTLKIHSIPMEMKRPPQFLVYARDHFFS